MTCKGLLSKVVLTGAVLSMAAPAHASDFSGLNLILFGFWIFGLGSAIALAWIFRAASGGGDRIADVLSAMVVSLAIAPSTFNHAHGETTFYIMPFWLWGFFEDHWLAIFPAPLISIVATTFILYFVFKRYRAQPSLERENEF